MGDDTVASSSKERISDPSQKPVVSKTENEVLVDVHEVVVG